ncbi:hypothetical protein GO003_001015 [Methylicorpusculum oleiharenae]|uniref:hypothetical protein n=1 Tax=Methylicorpusculum oleiharenae TaxID=1338687 RepID=UPI001E35E044|nr:hypothetical protein [Methylicorpusculum oleiharenae]MCD2448976.1 hypothetical protein [Methylicorpusculum oleiharenae]
MTELAESEILPELSDELSELVENEHAPSMSGKQTSARFIPFERERCEHKCMIFSWLIKKNGFIAFISTPGILPCLSEDDVSVCIKPKSGVPLGSIEGDYNSSY